MLGPGDRFLPAADAEGCVPSICRGLRVMGTAGAVCRVGRPTVRRAKTSVEGLDGVCLRGDASTPPDDVPLWPAPLPC